MELLELFPKLSDYYEWFIAEKKPLTRDEISSGLSPNVCQCMWIDGVGRRIMLRRKAIQHATVRLLSLMEDEVQVHSWVLRCHLLNVVFLNPLEERSRLFIWDDEGDMLPIPVFSKVSPNRATNFLLHMLLVLGEYETELDFREANSMKEAFQVAKLIKDTNTLSDNEAFLREQIDIVLRRVINEILPLQPLTMRRLDDAIVWTEQLLQSAILSNSMPLSELPPCIATELFNERDEELRREWIERKDRHLNSMLGNFPDGLDGLPSKAEILKATKVNPVVWNPLTVLKR